MSTVGPLFVRRYTHDHKGQALSPAMGELLNATVIPVPKRNIKRKIKESRVDGQTVVSPQSSPYFGDIDDGAFEDEFFDLSLEQRPVLGGFSPPSISTIFDEAGSPNSLESDWTSDDGGLSCPSPLPFESKRVASVRKKIEFPVAEACDAHPLTDVDSLNDEVDSSFGKECEPCALREKSEERKSRLPLSFVSNLTASLKALQSVAMSISTSQEKLYARSLFAFSPRVMDEPIPRFLQRPKHSPTTSSTHKHPKAISLTTYNVQSTVIAHLRPRELRVNSQFYRVYAVETLMRLNGKLDDEFPGRARPILEPRLDNRKYFLDDGDEVFGIKKRFVSQFDVKEKKNKSVTIPSSRWHCWNANDDEENDDNDFN